MNVPALRFPEFEGEWESKPIGARLAKVVDYRGKAPPKTDTGIPLITARNVRMGHLDFTADEYIDQDLYETWMNRGLPKPNDVLFTTEAPLGNVALHPSEGTYALGQRIITLQADAAELDSIFLFQFLIGPIGQKKVDKRGTGSTAKGIKSKLFIKIPMAAPSLPEQKKIAVFLGVVDAKITALRDRVAGLERYKRGLMQALFSQTLRFTKPDGTPFPDWQEKRLGVLMDVISGLTYSPDDIRDTGLLVLRSSNVKDAALVLKDTVYVDVDVEAEKLTRAGDILLCVRNGSQRLIGKSALVPKEVPKATHGAFMSVLRGSNNAFLFQLMQTDLFFREVHKNLGATINSINGSDLRRFKFLLPTHSDEQTKIAEALSAMDAKIAAVTAQLDRMQDFKKGLLQQVFV